MQSALTESLAVSRIDCAPQVRRHFDENRIEELARSIRAVGVLQPLLVRPSGDRFIVVDGECRLRAAKRAGLESVPVVLAASDLTSADILQRQLVANCQRSDLSPLEKANAIRQLAQETQWTAGETAKRLGTSEATVSRLLALLTLPAEIQAELAKGNLTASTAYELAKVNDPAARAKLASDAKSGALTRDGLAAKRKGLNGPSQTPGGNTARAVALLGNGREITIRGSGLSLERVAEWLEELLARIRKVRTQNLTLETFLTMLRDQANARPTAR